MKKYKIKNRNLLKNKELKGKNNLKYTKTILKIQMKIIKKKE
jgi:hypothetical protein